LPRRAITIARLNALENDISETLSQQCRHSPLADRRIPTGFIAISPRLRGTSYPGTTLGERNPERVAASSASDDTMQMHSDPAPSQDTPVTTTSTPSPLEERAGVRRIPTNASPTNSLSPINMNNKRKETVMQSNNKQEKQQAPLHLEPSPATDTIQAGDILRLLGLPPTATIEDIKRRLTRPGPSPRKTEAKPRQRIPSVTLPPWGHWRCVSTASRTA
jgi:hypothetical protein